MKLDYTSHLRSDGDKMTAAVARDLDAHVPTCPEWNVAKLAIHTGRHHRWVAQAIRGKGTPPDEPANPGLRGDALVDWFRQGWTDLADLLDGVDDSDPAWTWSGDDRVGFWRRRTTLETLVHRFDAENAVGEAGPLDPALSADGIDEMLFVMLGEGGAYHGPRLHVAISASDTGGRWLVGLEDGSDPRAEVVTGGLPPADVTVTGPASDVLLFLWGRYGQDAVGVDGSDEARAALSRWMTE